MRTELQTTVSVLKQRIGDWLSLTSVSVKGRLILHCCNADSKNMELNNLTSYAIMILFVLTDVIGQNSLKSISELVFSSYISHLICHY